MRLLYAAVSFVNPTTAARGTRRSDPSGNAPFGEVTKRHQAKWITEADAKVRPRLRARRRKGASVLTKIAEQPPAKLPKLPRKFAWQAD